MDDAQHLAPQSMDISHQEQTFHGFVRFIRWAVGATFVFLILLAMYNA